MLQSILRLWRSLRNLIVFIRIPGESYSGRLVSLLLYLCYIFRALISSLVCWFCTSGLGLVLFQISVHLNKFKKRNRLSNHPRPHMQGVVLPQPFVIRARPRNAWQERTSIPLTVELKTTTFTSVYTDVSVSHNGRKSWRRRTTTNVLK